MTGLIIGPTELVAFLGFGSVFTVGTLTLYETFYRPRFDRNAHLLVSHFTPEATKIIATIKFPIEPGALSDAFDKLNQMNGKCRRPNDLLHWRQYQLGLLMLLVVVSVVAFILPDSVFLNTSLSYWATIVLAITGCANGAFLLLCIRLDNRLNEISGDYQAKAHSIPSAQQGQQTTAPATLTSNYLSVKMLG